MGELAHPDVDFAKHRAALEAMNTVKERADHLIASDLYAAALIGTLATGPKHDDRLRQLHAGNDDILGDPENADRTGRQIGYGLQPQINFDRLSKAIIANSNTLTATDRKDAIAEVNSTINKGAWLYTPFQPRRSSAGKGIAGHVDAFFVPDEDHQPWAVTSLIDPTLTGSSVVMERLNGLGFASATPPPPRTALEKLYSDTPPNSAVGSWNVVIATDLDPKGRDLTFARLAAAQTADPNKVVYETMLIPKIRLDVEHYREARLIYVLQRKVKEKAAKNPTIKAELLTLGTHSGINSCAQFTASFFTEDARCGNLASVIYRAIMASVECFATTVNDKEPFKLILDGGDDDFTLCSKDKARSMLTEYFAQPTLYTSNRPGRAAYCENYSECSRPHPDEDAREVFDIAADTALDLIAAHPVLSAL
jgi:hypothetical protein